MPLLERPAHCERQHHRAKTTRIAALARKRHPLIVLELQL
jgi:hypothetical protein